MTSLIGGVEPKVLLTNGGQIDLMKHRDFQITLRLYGKQLVVGVLANPDLDDHPDYFMACHNIPVELPELAPDPRVDRVARALCDRFDTQDAPVQDSLRQQARKAISAMEMK